MFLSIATHSLRMLSRLKTVFSNKSVNVASLLKAFTVSKMFQFTRRNILDFRTKKRNAFCTTENTSYITSSKFRRISKAADIISLTHQWGWVVIWHLEHWAISFFICTRVWMTIPRWSPDYHFFQGFLSKVTFFQGVNLHSCLFFRGGRLKIFPGIIFYLEGWNQKRFNFIT